MSQPDIHPAKGIPTGEGSGLRRASDQSTSRQVGSDRAKGKGVIQTRRVWRLGRVGNGTILCLAGAHYSKSWFTKEIKTESLAHVTLREGFHRGWTGSPPDSRRARCKKTETKDGLLPAVLRPPSAAPLAVSSVPAGLP